MIQNLKAGKYFVGDPCYVINNGNWDKILVATDHFRNENQTFKGIPIFVAHTNGDCTYRDNYDADYSLDTGLIGVIPVEVFDKNFEGVGGKIVEFKNDFKAYKEDEIIYIGHLELCSAEELDEEDLEEICDDCGEPLWNCCCDD